MQFNMAGILYSDNAGGEDYTACLCLGFPSTGKARWSTRRCGYEPLYGYDSTTQSRKANLCPSIWDCHQHRRLLQRRRQYSRWITFACLYLFVSSSPFIIFSFLYFQYFFFKCTRNFAHSSTYPNLRGFHTHMWPLLKMND